MGSEQSISRSDQDHVTGMFENNFRVEFEERMKKPHLNEDPFYSPSRRSRIIRLQKVVCDNGAVSGSSAAAAGLSNSNSTPIDNSQQQQQQPNATNGIPMDKVYSVREVYADGSNYEGQKLKQYRSGYGVFTFINKAVYKGTWFHDQMNGRGLLYYSSGQLAYSGNFRDNQFDGHGMLMNEIVDYSLADDDSEYFKDITRIDRKWIKFEGIFEHDKKFGLGKLHFANGDVLSGNFVNDKVQGEALLTRSDSKTIRGIWVESVLTQIIG